MVLQVESSKDVEKVDDFYSEAIWPVLAVARIFAIMPVTGLRQNISGFKWFTPSAVFSLCFIALVYILTILQARLTFSGRVSTSSYGGMIFYVSVIFNFHLFFIMARNWNKTIFEWREKESIFLAPPYERHGWYLRWKVRTTAIFFFALAILEHVLAFAQGVSSYNLKVDQCQVGLVKDRWTHYFTTEYFHIFSLLPFNNFIAIFITWFNTVMAILWNYSDIFIITVGLALSTRFKQLNNRITSLHEKNPNFSLWSEMRQHYVLLCELLENIDKDLGPLILLSCANNLYFICLQLLHIFDELPHFLNYIYYWYSLVLLIGRTIVMLLCTSEIHDASQKPLEMVRKVGSSVWNAELERFSDQLTHETIALSGMNFFFMTRKLVLGMIGTIITYELVLLQFDSESKEDADTVKKELNDFCNLKSIQRLF